MAAAQFNEQVQQAYLAYYGRPADPAGQAFWANQLSLANGNLSAIINAFGTSAESTALYSGSSAVAQVNAIYNQLFGHSADVAGLNFYVNALNQGTFTLASIALNIYNGATGTDATELTAKLAYADAFTLAVGQSTQAQVAYSGTAASNNARTAVASVVDTTSGAAAQAALATTVANIGGSPAVQAFTLTTGADNLVGAASGNNVFNGFTAAGANATGDTLQGGDSIQGKGTGNVLNITTTGTTTPGADVTAGAMISGVQTINVRNSGIAATTATLNASNTPGATAVNSNLSTGALQVTNLAAGASAGIIGNGTTVNGSLNANYVASATAATLNLSGGVNETAAGTVTINGTGITSTTVNSTGAANKIGGLTLQAADTALTINAATNLTTGAISGPALKTITVSGAAAQVDLSGAALSNVTTVNASGLTAGGVKFTNGNTGVTFTGGANNNFFATGGIVLNTTGANIGSVNAGTGTGNTLDVSVLGDVGSATIGALYKGFNTLQVESGVVQDASFLAANNTITAAVVNGVGGAATSLFNLASGVGVTIGNSANATTGAANTIDYQTAGSLTLGIKGATTVGQIDTLNVTVNDSVAASAAAGSSAVKLGILTATGIENLAFHVANAGDTLNISALTSAASASSITFDGVGAASVVTGAWTPVTNSAIDAHNLSGTFTLDASAALANPIAVKGAIGVNTITLQNTTVNGDVVDLSANVKGGSTINTGTATGNATITLGTHAAADTITIADGAFVDGGTGALTLVNNFTAGSTTATSDILKFAGAGGLGGETIATGTFAAGVAAGQTGFANLSATAANGIVTFGGSAASTASVATLIQAAENIVKGAIDTVAAFVNGGNTYVVESTHGGALGNASTHVIELVGVSSLTSIGSAAGAGVLHIA